MHVTLGYARQRYLELYRVVDAEVEVSGFRFRVLGSGHHEVGLTIELEHSLKRHVSDRSWGLQQYLAHKKPPPPRTLQ